MYEYRPGRMYKLLPGLFPHNITPSKQHRFEPAKGEEGYWEINNRKDHPDPRQAIVLNNQCEIRNNSQVDTPHRKANEGSPPHCLH